MRYLFLSWQPLIIHKHRGVRWYALKVVTVGLATVTLELKETVNEGALDRLLNQRDLHTSVCLGRTVSRRPVAMALEFVPFNLWSATEE